jgi:hypothetical protein
MQPLPSGWATGNDRVLAAKAAAIVIVGPRSEGDRPRRDCEDRPERSNDDGPRARLRARLTDAQRRLIVSDRMDNRGPASDGGTFSPSGARGAGAPPFRPAAA